MNRNPLKKDYYAHPNKYIENNNKLPYLNQSYTLPKKCINKYRELDREVGRKTTYLYKDIKAYKPNYARKCASKHSADGDYFFFHKLNTHALARQGKRDKYRAAIGQASQCLAAIDKCAARDNCFLHD